MDQVTTEQLPLGGANRYTGFNSYNGLTISATVGLEAAHQRRKQRFNSYNGLTMSATAPLTY